MLKEIYPADTAWFRERLRAKKLSIRKTAKLLGLDASSLSRIFRGLQRIRLDEATTLARILEVSLFEVLRRTGTEPPPPEAMTLPLVGSVNGSLCITTGGGHAPVTSMPLFEQSAVGVICDDGASPFYGWIFAYIPASDIQPSAIGRLSVVHLADGTGLIRFLQPGLHAGRFNLVPIAGRAFQNVNDVRAAAPVLHIKPFQSA